MAKDTQRARKLSISGTLTLGVGATMRQRRKGSEGYDIIRPLSENFLTLTTTHTVTEEENGTTFILNTATAFVITLPLPQAGLEYWFYIGATAPTTTHTVVTAASANIIQGNLASPDLDAASDVVTVADADVISFVASKALHGDFAHVKCDGTDWYLDGMCKAFDGMSTAST